MTGGVLHVNDVAGVASTLSREVSRLGFRSAVFQPTLGTYARPLTQRAALVVTRPKEALRLRRTYREGAFSFLHVHFGSFGAMGIVAGGPQVIHCHGSDVVGGALVHRLVTRLLLPAARGVFYSTPNLGPVVKRWRSDAVFLPNPVDDAAFHIEPVEPVRDIFVASKLDPSKGIPQAIEALRQIRLARPLASIAMLSVGREARRLSDHAARTLGDTIEWLPRLTHAEMLATVNSSRVILGQLGSGAIGVTELEAMALKRPVVGYWVHDEAYGAPAPIVVARSAGEAAEATVALLDDDAGRARIGSAGREWCAAQHGPRAVGQRALDWYERWGLL
jgi:glycosyltransferase involved in cell wall biosynthesis